MKSELHTTQFGLINKEWNLVPFENIMINQNNGLYKPKEFQGKGTKIVKMGNQFGHPRVYNQDMDRYDLTENELKKFRLNYDDLLFSRRSLVFEGAGECSVVKEKYESLIFESSIIRVTLNKEIASPDYFFYFFQSHLGKQIIRSINQGTSVAGITGADLKKILVPLPNIIEQKNIVQIFIKIDDLLENLQKQNKILEQIAQAIFKSWFVDFDGVTEFEDSELGKIPKGWKIGKIKDTVEIFDGKRIPLSMMERMNRKGHFPYYGATTIIDFIDDYIFDGTFLLLGEDGSVIHDDDTPFIQYVKGKFWVNNHAHVIQGKNEFSTEFIYLFFKNLNVNRWITGTTQLKINQSNLLSIPIIIPDEIFLKKFNHIIHPIFSNILDNEKLISTLSKTRDALLPKLLSGEIRV